MAWYWEGIIQNQAAAEVFILLKVPKVQETAHADVSSPCLVGGGPVTDDGIFAYFICKNNESQTLSVQRCIHASPQKQARWKESRNLAR